MDQTDSGTLVGRIFPPQLSPRINRRFPRLVLEALICTEIALYLALVTGFAEPGLVSIFLVSASLSERIRFLLNENRINVWENEFSSWEANKLTTLSFIAIFCGIISAYFAFSFGAGTDGIFKTFGFAIEAAGLNESTLFTREFSSFGGILTNNLIVLICICILAFVYRAYGAMLALSWNACVWAAVITALTLRSADVTESKLSLVEHLLAASALLPHLIVEGAAYVIGALAAIYCSQGISKYPIRDPRFGVVMRACLLLFFIAGVLVTAGSWLESSFVPFVFGRL